MKLLKHASYGADLGADRSRGLYSYKSKLIGQEQLAFELGEGAEANSHKASQLIIPHAPTALS
jgi:hypothetical protein